MILNISGEIIEGSYIDYLTKFSQAGEGIDLVIDSIGGLVTEGELIAAHISKNADRFLSVKNSGDVASIAATIFLSLPFEKRFFDPALGVAVIHLPIVDMQGHFNAEELVTLASEVQVIQSRLAKNISSSTGADLDLVTAIMALNVPMTVDQMNSIKFANVTQVETLSTSASRAVAYYKSNIKQTEMKETEVEEMIKVRNEGLLAKIKNLFRFKAVILTDAKGSQIEFPEVPAGADLMVGDMASDTNLNGDIVMSDGSTVTFEAGKVTAIKPKADEPEAKVFTQADIDAAVQAATAKASIEVEANIRKSLKSEFLATIKEVEEESKSVKFSYNGRKK